ncbi:hypothetical protein GQ42DRAFT_152932 [Ramicandelaber brevisporus]|nr:hypothetical protein GQ42DRAFT_152932 [Ramicandelaber brevisporus]
MNPDNSAGHPGMKRVRSATASNSGSAQPGHRSVLFKMPLIQSQQFPAQFSTDLPPIDEVAVSPPPKDLVEQFNALQRQLGDIHRSRSDEEHFKHHQRALSLRSALSSSVGSPVISSTPLPMVSQSGSATRYTHIRAQTMSSAPAAFPARSQTSPLPATVSTASQPGNVEPKLKRAGHYRGLSASPGPFSFGKFNLFGTSVGSSGTTTPSTPAPFIPALGVATNHTHQKSKSNSGTWDQVIEERCLENKLSPTRARWLQFAGNIKLQAGETLAIGKWIADGNRMVVEGNAEMHLAKELRHRRSIHHMT